MRMGLIILFRAAAILAVIGILLGFICPMLAISIALLVIKLSWVYLLLDIVCRLCIRKSLWTLILLGLWTLDDKDKED